MSHVMPSEIDSVGEARDNPKEDGVLYTSYGTTSNARGYWKVTTLLGSSLMVNEH